MSKSSKLIWKLTKYTFLGQMKHKVRFSLFNQGIKDTTLVITWGGGGGWGWIS